MSDKAKSPVEKSSDKKPAWVKTGVAVGIGSAAIVAALLYANRTRESRKKD